MIPFSRFPTAAIEVTSLSKTYRTRQRSIVRAVDNLSLSVPAGQIFGLLGANGAGKTTTIKMICGLITPTSGRVLVNGYDVAHERSAAIRQIGVVLEGTRNVYWRLTAWENLLYFGRLKGVSGQPLKARAEQLLRELQLWEQRNDTLRTYSRGMQQKVAIACALVTDPPLILLDEPTLGLDVQAACVMKEWVIKLAQEQGKTVVLTTHQLDIAQELCDRIAIMHKGQLVADQPLSELLHLFSQERYQIRVKGNLADLRAACFGNLTVRSEHGEVILTGAIADQATLYHYLTRLQDLSLPLLSVRRVEPDLEEIFMELLTRSEKGEQREDRVLSSVQ
ncbi:MAG TPA: ABC transporter ATP-binding protein [Ktedonobacteraceae bacterium]|jgi:ABC-2 type transport system ATP-binding protein|nr:ABC transporter ATP-binding protein [Ktedonobacteraceae bacterium]